MVRIQPGIVDVLKEPDLLMDMHAIAERKNTMYAVSHALVKQLALRAFGLQGEMYASLGAGVQEIVSDFVEPEHAMIRVMDSYNTAVLLDAPRERISDIVLDVLDGFRRVEPELFDTIHEINASHLAVPSSQNLAMFGAALSHSMQLAQRRDDLHLR